MDEKKNEKSPETLDYDALDGSLKFDGPPADFQVKMADISWVKRKKLDVVYAEKSPNQRLDLYYPEEGEGPFAILLHIHGGGFGLGDKRDDHMDTYLKFLKRGIAVGSIEYRLSGEAIFPAAVLDCREAVRFLRRNAAAYQIDPDRIAAIGGSAGGNLSAMLAMNIPNGMFPGEEGRTFDGSCEVSVAVDQFGPIDFAVMDEMARENGVSFVDHDQPGSAESSYMGGALPELERSYLAKANPITYINDGMAPLLVQHGCVDRLVPYQQSVLLVDAIKKQIGEERVEFTTLPTADHEDKLYGTDENLDIVWEFVKKYL
ncbi:MAG: alpha/beta hydrolase [Lachnospiraceae bacterium]|nr:alpha/beta hydrolase [Lachnospiraceae bacterium]